MFQMAEMCSSQADARRVVGLHLVSMVIWVLKLLPFLPKEGCWYLVSAPRKRCNIHLRHLRLISACTCRGDEEMYKQDEEGGVKRVLRTRGGGSVT